MTVFNQIIHIALVCAERSMSVLPGEGGPLSCIKGVSELFDSVVLARQAEDALFIQSMFFNELHTLLHQDWYHVRPETLLICYGVHETLSKHYRDAEKFYMTFLYSMIRKNTYSRQHNFISLTWCLCQL